MTQSQYKNNSRMPYFIAGALVGSALFYFLDPDKGSYRRSKLRDKSLKFKNDSAEYGGKMWRHLRNQIQGFYATINRWTEEPMPVSNDVLVARVRSEFGRKISHSRPVKVEADDGIVTLSGPILSREVRQLVRCVKNVPGVKDVINELVVYETPDGIPELQGEGPEYLRKSH